jgi:hypothetical protein
LDLAEHESEHFIPFPFPCVINQRNSAKQKFGKKEEKRMEQDLLSRYPKAFCLPMI